MSTANPQSTDVSAFVRTGSDPAGEACLHCERSDGEIFLFRGHGMAEWDGFPLHDMCSQACLQEYEEHEQCRLRGRPHKRLGWLEKINQERAQWSQDYNAYDRCERATRP